MLLLTGQYEQLSFKEMENRLYGDVPMFSLQHPWLRVSTAKKESPAQDFLFPIVSNPVIASATVEHMKSTNGQLNPGFSERGAFRAPLPQSLFNQLEQ